MQTTTFQQQRRRKFLLVAPLLVLPFLTLLFWGLGGGNAAAENPLAGQAGGFNTHLPDARLKDEHGLNKLSYYDRAAADSAKLKQAQQTDPYAKKIADSTTGHTLLSAPVFFPHQPTGFITPDMGNGPAAKEAMIKQRLAELQAEVNKTPKPPANNSQPNTAATNQAAYNPVYNAKPSGAVQPVVTTEDPELKQMNGLLEKILDIQHPDRLKEKSTTHSAPEANEPFKAIPAVVDGNQKIVQGTVIRLKLLDSARLNGQLFPKGQLIYGSGDLYNQRVRINIKLLHLGLNIIPVDLTVFDMTDGMEGIDVPEAVTGGALKDGAVNGVQNMDLMSFDPSVSAQLTTAGINTAKGLFSKKIKRVKGRLKNGHLLLLRDNKSLQAGH